MLPLQQLCYCCTVATVSVQVAVGVNESFNEKIVKSRLKWASDVERMGGDKLAKR